MTPALVLTEEKAEELGYSGAGPFTFSGVFPGVWVPGEPVRISELGFTGEDETREALGEAFADAAVAPLEWTEVGEGEGYAIRENHAAPIEQVREAVVDEAVEDALGKKAIRSHADADLVAEELGISFGDGTKLADKVQAIEDFKAGQATLEGAPLVLEDGSTPGEPDDPDAPAEDG